MSVTFISDAPAKETIRSDACICSQGAPHWTYPCDHIDAIRAELREYANPRCPLCGGSGVEDEKVSDRPEINWNQGNAFCLFRALGLPVAEGEHEPYGELTIPEARRAIMRARGRGDLAPFTRQEETLYGAPRADETGVVELHPLRAQTTGLSEEGVEGRISQFEQFVAESASRGATLIRWF